MKENEQRIKSWGGSVHKAYLAIVRETQGAITPDTLLVPPGYQPERWDRWCQNHISMYEHEGLEGQMILGPIPTMLLSTADGWVSDHPAHFRVLSTDRPIGGDQ